MQAIRMTEDADGAPHGHTVYHYTAGEVYSPESQPPATEPLMRAFVASKRAVDVDALGNPTVTAASRRAKKGASATADVETQEDTPETPEDAPAPSRAATADPTPATTAADPTEE